MGKAEEEFEALIEQFKQNLESVKPTPSRSRLRPNYSTQWIEELKGKLSKLSTQNDSGSSNESANYSEIVAAVPCAGF